MILNRREKLKKIRFWESFENHYYQKHSLLGRKVELPTSTVLPLRREGQSRIIGSEEIYFSNHPNPKLRNTIRRKVKNLL
jgi:hypothetical protein